MNELPRDILQRIGNTSLLALRNIVPKNGSHILLKLESENPTGSMKDRMALAMIEAAEADGRLKARGSVVEYTAGSTGVSLSLVCAVKGYSLHIVSSDAFAQEKLDHMKILGAKLQILHSESGGMTEKLTRDMIEAAGVIAKETGAFCQPVGAVAGSKDPRSPRLCARTGAAASPAPPNPRKRTISRRL